jgi:hypothetical protein
VAVRRKPLRHGRLPTAARYHHAMEMRAVTAEDIMAFVPAQGRYDDAIRFYEVIGFEVDFRSDSISVIRKDQCRFFLQNVAWAGARDNFMMYLEVNDLDAWWEMLSGLNLSEKFDGVRIRDPEDYPWGKREIHLIDPCGVLWHIAASTD